MKLLDSLRFFASNLIHRSRTEQEMEDELHAHIQTRADEIERTGIESAEAERRARVEFGSYQRFKEECREASGTHFFETLRQDAAFGLRMLRKSPGFTAVAALTLALGIGANTAVFSVVYAALLRPLPYAQPNRLIMLSEVRSQQDHYWDASYPDYLDWTHQSKTLSSIAGFGGDGFVLRGAGEPQLVSGVQTTTNFFTTLGVKPMLGRDFAAGEDQASGPNVAILGHKFWASRFASDPHVIGRAVQLDSKSVTIIGVLPPEFEFAPQGAADVWVPLHLGPNMASRRNLRWLSVVARIAPGFTAAQARAEMNLINANLAKAYPAQNGAVQILMAPLRQRIVGQVQPLLLIIFGAVAFVLLIACANLANLLMVRAAGRRREFAIRTAIGAGRGRLVSQILSESLMLAAAGGIPGFFLAMWGTRLLIAAIPEAELANLPFLADGRANPVVLAFLCAAAVLTGVVFGLAPAMQVARESAGSTLKQETRASTGSRARLRQALVVSEIAVSMVLLIGAGLMVKSLGALLHRNPGFDTRDLLTFSVNLPDTSYPKDPDALRFDREFRDRLAALPGVEGIVSNSVIPLTGGDNTIRFLIEGKPAEPGHEDESSVREISSNYFSMMRIPLRSGRAFDDAADAAGAREHVIVNQAWANRFLPGENPIGKRVRFTFSPQQKYREIVGVAANIADSGLDSPEQPSLFLPFTQDANSFINYLIRVRNPEAAIGAIRDALRQQDPQLLLIQPKTMEQIIAQSPSVFLRRYPSYLIGSFSALALILAMIGLYGLISYSVSQRTNELGIRIALGAGRGDILRLVLREGARLALAGVAVGIIAALALTRLMSALLYGVSAVDSLTFAGVAGLLALVAIAACCVPARRAMATDPIAALRWE